MTDYPIPAKISLPLANKKTMGVEFISFAKILYQQHLIYAEPRELRLHKNVAELTVIFRDKASFKNWYKKLQVIPGWKLSFDKLLTDKPKTIKEKDVIIEADNVANCTCTNSGFYILRGRSLRFINELTCNKCFKQVSYSRIPVEIGIENWQVKYQRVYLNWLESGLFENEACKELMNYKKGKLNLEGEKIRKALAAYFKIPVYIDYFTESETGSDKCLICGDTGSDSGIQSPKKICRYCNTIFDYHI